jgi:hypothetical protein
MNLFSWLLGDKPQVKPVAARGFSFHIGLNSVDPKAYGGWDGKLNACENDAIDLRKWFDDHGFETTIRLTKTCTARGVLEHLEYMAAIVKPGDLFVFTNSSHGGQVPDFDGDEVDGADETLCMYDREILDDELEAAWAKFKAGVRIFVISDSCHSGTVMRARTTSAPHGARYMPQQTRTLTLQDTAYVDRLMYAARGVANRAKIKAHVLSYGGCQDNQYSMDGTENGAFTGALLAELDGGRSFGHLIKRVRRRLPASQTPSYVYGGPRCESWEASRAFSI